MAGNWGARHSGRTLEMGFALYCALWLAVSYSLSRTRSEPESELEGVHRDLALLADEYQVYDDDLSFHTSGMFEKDWDFNKPKEIRRELEALRKEICGKIEKIAQRTQQRP